MTHLMVARCDKNIFTAWECGQKWRENREAILIPTLDHGNVSKCLLDLLGGRDKLVQGTGDHCSRAVNQLHHFDTCQQSHLQVLSSLIDQVQLISYALGVLFVVRWRVLFVQQIPFIRALWISHVAWFGWGSKVHSNQMSWFMHGPQS